MVRQNFGPTTFLVTFFGHRFFIEFMMYFGRSWAPLGCILLSQGDFWRPFWVFSFILVLSGLHFCSCWDHFREILSLQEAFWKDFSVLGEILEDLLKFGAIYRDTLIFGTRCRRKPAENRKENLRRRNPSFAHGFSHLAWSGTLP